uniref:EGF-like domain-containing protein n=1 Tax=Timema genevievae TaxID=629358 RepID=A0A7R9PS77_TIMGE|nr:unnamed protein product [Timema genevievae]
MKKLVEDNVEVKQSEGDSDTLIIQTAIDCSMSEENCVIVGEDVDPLVLLTAFVPETPELCFVKPGRGKEGENSYQRCSRRCNHSLRVYHQVQLWQGVQCVNSNTPPYYRCSGCPPGSTGNGTTCHDLDECDLAGPCDPHVRCVNLSPGYRCDACPQGFTGSSGLEGIGLEVALHNRQRCYDIDECADGRNGGCDPNSACTNTEVGSHHTFQPAHLHMRNGGCDLNSACTNTEVGSHHTFQPAPLHKGVFRKLVRAQETIHNIFVLCIA